MIFNQVDTTHPVKSFVLEQLTKNENIDQYQNMELSEVIKSLKKKFKCKMDPWLYRRAKWIDVAQTVKEKSNEDKGDEDDEDY